MSYAPVVLTSALTGRGVQSVPETAARVFDQWCRRVPTGDLNRHFEEIVTRRPPPSGPAGRHVKLYYITQADVSPPMFYVSTNQPTAIGLPYRRYLTNQLRAIYGFEGAPLKVVLRKHGQGKGKGKGAGRGATGAGADAGSPDPRAGDESEALEDPADADTDADE
jgi:GTP-binding protein